MVHCGTLEKLRSCSGSQMSHLLNGLSQTFHETKSVKEESLYLTRKDCSSRREASGLEGNNVAGAGASGRGGYLRLGLLTLNLTQCLHLRRLYPLPPRTKPNSSRCLHPLKDLPPWPIFCSLDTPVHTGDHPWPGPPGLTMLTQSNGELGTQRLVWSE